MGFLPQMLPQSYEQRRASIRRTLLRHEAKVGGTLFGPVPKGHRREFFCLDRYTWVWHEEWVDANGQRQIVTTNYLIRPEGIMKSQNGRTYQSVKGQELRNFYNAAKLYSERMPAELNRVMPTPA